MPKHSLSKLQRRKKGERNATNQSSRVKAASFFIFFLSFLFF